MTCDCISTVNAMLAERNTKLMLPITFSSLNDPTEPQRLMVVTDQIETGRGKKKAAGMFATYCPFCGVSYSKPVAPAVPDTDVLGEALRIAWTNFLDANPDDLTSPEDLPDHALMTGEQFEHWALEAFASQAEV